MEEAFLEALHDAPLDEASWLALADWLEEEADPCAELVRARVLLRQQTGERRLALEARVRRLIQAGVRPCVPMRTNSLGMSFALISPGEFLMGSPLHEADRRADETQHVVRISRPFYLGACLVTQEQFARVWGEHVNYFSAAGRGAQIVAGLDTRTFAADSIRWSMAREFCSRLGHLPAEKQKGWTYRLASEAEWEYACRADDAGEAPFHFGEKLAVKQANVSAGSGPRLEFPDARALGRTCAVGSYPSSAWGLFDMHGQVWEWCADWFAEDYYTVSPIEDPPGPAEGERKVQRGGSWGCHAVDCRIARRSWSSPEFSGNGLGFRVVLNWPAKG
jgi:uncharacterized protein (TIGR02996 family)